MNHRFEIDADEKHVFIYIKIIRSIYDVFPLPDIYFKNEAITWGNYDTNDSCQFYVLKTHNLTEKRIQLLVIKCLNHPKLFPLVKEIKN